MLTESEVWKTTVSPYLMIPALAWLLAQLTKYVLQGLKKGSLKDWRLLYKSGDMPSSHAALMISLLTVIGVKSGVESALFGVVAIVTGVVIYDAVNVRRAVGDQGAILGELTGKRFYRAKGHTPVEVAAGSAVGFLVSILMLQFL